MQSQYNNWSERAVVLDQAFPSSPQLISVLKIVEKIASDNKLAIVSMQVTQLPKDVDPNIDPVKLNRLIYPISVTVVGDYPSIRQFISDIQNSRRVISTDTITFNTKDKADKRRLSATIILTAHYFGEENK